MTNPIPFLAFDGTCKQAMHFYERALGGRIAAMMRMGDAPAPHQVPPEAKDLVMYADLVLPDGGRLYGSDCTPCMPYQGIHGVSLAMNFASTAEARKAFDALSEGGQVIMAPQATFWAKEFSMCVDRFGATWSLNGERLDT